MRRLASLLILIAGPLTMVAEPSHAALKFGVDPNLPSPSPSYEEDRSELQTKRFAKVRYRRIDPIDKETAWQRTINLLEQQSRLDIEIEYPTGLLDFELKLAKGYYDLAYISPIQFASFNTRNGYKAVAKRKAQPLRGLVVIRADNTAVQSLRDLKGQTMVFPGLLDFESSIAPRVSLHKLSIPYIPEITKDAETAYQQVLDGMAPSAAGSRISFQSLPPPKQQQLKIIWDTPGFTPYAFAAHTRVPVYSLIRLQKALVGLTKSDTGRELLPLIHASNGFEVAKDSDWHDVRDIDLNQLNNLKLGEPVSQNNALP